MLVSLLPGSNATPAVAGTPTVAEVAGEPDSTPVPAALLEKRRTALLALLEPGIAIVPSASRRASWEHPQDSDFRQDNNFYYLTGLETPDSWLVLFKSEGESGRAMLFVPETSSHAEMWSGPQPGPGPETARWTGIDAIRPADSFAGEILDRLGQPGALNEFQRVYLPLGAERSATRAVIDAAVAGRRSISDLGRALASLRLVKDEEELANLRRAIQITAEAQRAALEAAEPGMYEYELEAIVEYIFRSRGADRVGFPSIVGSGPNSVVLHHDRNRRRTEEGDLVVIDVGAEVGYYTADVTRTFPVSGVFGKRQREIYELVLATQQTVIDSVRPGITILELEQIARRFMRKHSNRLCGSSTCDRFFVHGLSHWLGMDVHDVGDYSRPLAPGMVLTVEPGIYLADEELGVRIEDDVLVTETGHEVLSAGAPKTVEEIEALMAAECECEWP
jgi:Xaa-Pro aminopeptidase